MSSAMIFMSCQYNGGVEEAHVAAVSLSTHLFHLCLYGSGWSSVTSICPPFPITLQQLHNFPDPSFPHLSCLPHTRVFFYLLNIPIVTKDKWLLMRFSGFAESQSRSIFLISPESTPLSSIIQPPPPPRVPSESPPAKHKELFGQREWLTPHPVCAPLWIDAKQNPGIYRACAATQLTFWLLFFFFFNFTFFTLYFWFYFAPNLELLLSICL